MTNFVLIPGAHSTIVVVHTSKAPGNSTIVIFFSFFNLEYEHRKQIM